MKESWCFTVIGNNSQLGQHDENPNSQKAMIKA